MSDPEGKTLVQAVPAKYRPDEPAEGLVLRKVAVRLLPFLFLLYLVNILDRVNVGFAREHSDALGREVTYSDIPSEGWEGELKRVGLPEHLHTKGDMLNNRPNSYMVSKVKRAHPGRD